MPLFNIEVMQTYLVERTIMVQVEAVDINEAIERQEASDAPAFNDASWCDVWALQQEDIYEAIVFKPQFDYHLIVT